MRKELFLLTLLLALSLAFTVRAEDLEIPSFAGADGSCAILWDFVEPYPDADIWIYTPEIDAEFFADDNIEGAWGEDVLNWPGEQESRFYFTMPEGTGDNLTVFVQITYTGDPSYLWGFPEGWSAPADAGGDHLGGEEEDVEMSDPCEIDPNVFYITMTSTWDMHGEDPELAAVLIGSDAAFVIQQMVIDAVRHPDFEPPVGPGRRHLFIPIQVSNANPEDGEKHAPVDTNLSFQAPKEAFCINPNADPNLKGPFEYDVYFGTEPNVLTMAQLADGYEPANCDDVMVFDPCAGDFPLATTYYWRVDFNDANGGGDPCFYEGPYFSFTTIGLADNIYPADGAGDASVYADLKWAGDVWADTFDVYFSTDFTEVDSGVALVSDNQGPNTYDPGTLVLDTEYFWRIDEVNGIALKGDIWSFSTDISTVVDDMDSYVRYTNDIEDTWLDYRELDSRAEVSLSTTTAEDGNAMDLAFNNTFKVSGNLYGSWTTASVSDLVVGSDWNEINGKALQLSFYGQATNTADVNDKMYVVLEDASANVGVSYYPDVNDLNIEGWHEWDIDLQDFVDDNNVDLSNVSKISIGFGVYGGSTNSGTAGTVYIDNILLFTTRCVPAEAPGDATGDCVVNGDDIMELQVGWLVSDFEVPPEEPNWSEMLVEYLFTTGLEDTSGAPTYDGIDGDGSGTAVKVEYGYLSIEQLIGNDYHVEVPLGADNPFDGSQDYTVSMMVRVPTDLDGPYILFSSADEAAPNDPNNHSMHILKDAWIASGPGDDVWFKGGWVDIFHVDGSWASEVEGSWTDWTHVGVVYDAATTVMTYYLDGEPPGYTMLLDPNIPDIADDKVHIGDTLNLEYQDADTSGAFTGDIDDFRIFSSALSHANILWLAGKAEPTYVPNEEPSNVYPKVGPYGFDPNNVDIVDFRDFSVIAENWLAEEKLWP